MTCVISGIAVKVIESLGFSLDDPVWIGLVDPETGNEIVRRRVAKWKRRLQYDDYDYLDKGNYIEVNREFKANPGIRQLDSIKVGLAKTPAGPLEFLGGDVTVPLMSGTDGVYRFGATVIAH